MLEGDSGASDHGGNSARQHIMQPKLEASPQADLQATPEESKTPILSSDTLEESKGPSSNEQAPTRQVLQL